MIEHKKQKLDIQFLKFHGGFECINLITFSNLLGQARFLLPK
jgi:hypothetical protein